MKTVHADGRPTIYQFHVSDSVFRVNSTTRQLDMPVDFVCRHVF